MKEIGGVKEAKIREGSKKRKATVVRGFNA